MVNSEERSSPRLGFLEFFVLTVAAATIAVPLIADNPRKEDIFNKAVVYCRDKKAETLPENYGIYSGMKCSELELKVENKAGFLNNFLRDSNIYFY